MPNKTTQILKEFRREVWYPTPELKPSYEDVCEIAEKWLTEALSQQQQEDYQANVWCVVESVNGIAVDCRVFADQKEAHAYARGIREKLDTQRGATVYRNKIIRKSIAEKRGKV